MGVVGGGGGVLLCRHATVLCHHTVTHPWSHHAGVLLHGRVLRHHAGIHGMRSEAAVLRQPSVLLREAGIHRGVDGVGMDLRGQLRVESPGACVEGHGEARRRPLPWALSNG